MRWRGPGCASKNRAANPMMDGSALRRGWQRSVGPVASPAGPRRYGRGMTVPHFLQVRNSSESKNRL